MRLLLLAALLGACGAGLAACGGSVDAHTGVKDGTASREDVVSVLDATPFRVRYREVPTVQGFELIVGEATYRHAAVQFGVEIRLAGPFGKATDEPAASTQPPVLRYGIGLPPTEAGNLTVWTADQTPTAGLPPAQAARLEKVETAMDIRIGASLGRIFPERFRGEI